MSDKEKHFTECDKGGCPFKIGQPAVYCQEGYPNQYFVVTEIRPMISDSENYWFNEKHGSDCRKPTADELRAFYSPSYWK